MQRNTPTTKPRKSGAKSYSTTPIGTAEKSRGDTNILYTSLKKKFSGLFPVIVAQALPQVFYPIKGKFSSQPTKKHITDFSLSSNGNDTNPVAVLTFTYNTDAATMPSGTLHRRLVASIICRRVSFFLDEEQELSCWFSNRPCCLSTIRGKVSCVRA
jgi:hypothetical protein